ncbi:MAG TPA: BON domain-containing protein, partial [Acidimicrobiales bacterium]|nr:BON domain-containing protein [Acidimicrobiales bacterium]
MIEPDDYAIQRLREALATDERVAEMGLEIRIAAGKVFLTGRVPTEERRQAVGVVAGEVLPEYEVHNETVVTELGDQPRV